ncbi:MAG: metallophosphoesterase [Bacteroidetes bacterium]|nr:metallophosphoesterase [Bacteroidota bacterium]
MRILQFLVFFSIVLTVYGLVNYYIFIRGLHTFPSGNSLRGWYIAGFWFIASAFILGRILERFYLSPVTDFFTWMGSFWLAAMLYLFLAVVFIDLLRVIDYFVPFLGQLKQLLMISKPYYLSIALASGVFLLVLGGHVNAILPRVKQLRLDFSKQLSSREQLRIAMVSDVHLGTIVGKRRISRIVDMINALKPDIILIAGDLVDEDLAPVIRRDLGATLTKLYAPLGVFGVTGNHEYIGGAPQAVDYLQKHGITMLSDTVVPLFDKVFLGGREDYESRRFAGKTRKKLSAFTQNLPEDRFLILMDHQPIAINEAKEAGTGLLLSGHTHDGQLWPLNYLTTAIFQNAYGLKQFGAMYSYVSNGVGSWGPPVRIGNRPEIVEITLHFSKD